jgi:hypothetical protein
MTTKDWDFLAKCLAQIGEQSKMSHGKKCVDVDE